MPSEPTAWDNHQCPKATNPMTQFQSVVDRQGRTVNVMCTGCGERWERSSGPEEFGWWALGYIDGTRDAADLVTRMPTPERHSWTEAK